MEETQNNVAYLALGSNVGDRSAYIHQAQALLAAQPQIEIKKASTIYETEPWPKVPLKNGRPIEANQGWHLNRVLQIETSLNPQTLLQVCQNVEKQMGKKPKAEWGSRIIDIDMLLYDRMIVDSNDLKLPHHHLHQRAFVLIPLLEIAPQLVDPNTQRPYQSILNDLAPELMVRPYSEA